MRSALPALVSIGLLGGCAGNVADYIGSRPSIVRPQLIRYGFELQQSSCVGESLGKELTPLQLRRLVRSASALKQGPAEGGRLTPRDLVHVATSMSDPEIGSRLKAANMACGVLTEVPSLNPTETGTAPSAIPTPGTPGATPPPIGPRQSAWLNLGSAGTGQSIAVDASTIEQDASTRTAWFRLTNPGAAAPTGNSYHLRVDCAGKTIKSMAQRNAAGELREYGPPENNALPVEGGTVMEIAWLALCT
jgi:hypothetical protein